MTGLRQEEKKGNLLVKFKKNLRKRKYHEGQVRNYNGKLEEQREQLINLGATEEEVKAYS